MEPFLHLRRTCSRRKFMFYTNNTNAGKNINNQFIMTQSNRFDYFGVAVNLSQIKYIISHINGHWIPTREVQIRFAEFCPPPVKFSLKMAWPTETSNLVHWLTIASHTLPMKNLPWKGRGQGHVSNFYIAGLENFATASRRYTGDIHNSTRRRFVYDT